MAGSGSQLGDVKQTVLEQINQITNLHKLKLKFDACKQQLAEEPAKPMAAPANESLHMAFSLASKPEKEDPAVEM